MRPKQPGPSKKPGSSSGKPTIAPDNHHENSGQRDRSKDDEHDKVSSVPGKRDAKIGEDGVLTDDTEAG